MHDSLRLTSAIAVLLAWTPGQSFAQSVDQSFYYKLSTQSGATG
jgi:hypothetical protein